MRSLCLLLCWDLLTFTPLLNTSYCFNFYSTEHFILIWLLPYYLTLPTALTFTLLLSISTNFPQTKDLTPKWGGGAALHQWPPHLTAPSVLSFQRNKYKRKYKYNTIPNEEGSCTAVISNRWIHTKTNRKIHKQTNIKIHQHSLLNRQTDKCTYWENYGLIQWWWWIMLTVSC